MSSNLSKSKSLAFPYLLLKLLSQYLFWQTKDIDFLQALDKIHDTFESDLEAANSRITLLETIAAELRDLNYVNSENVDARLQGVRDTFTNLKQMSDDRKARIQEAIASQQNLDSIRLDYAKRAAVSLLIIAPILNTLNTRFVSIAWIEVVTVTKHWYMYVCVP